MDTPVPDWRRGVRYGGRRERGRRKSCNRDPCFWQWSFHDLEGVGRAQVRAIRVRSGNGIEGTDTALQSRDQQMSELGLR